MEINASELHFPESFAIRKETRYIVLHHAAAKTCSVRDVHEWHLAKGWNGIGYHFFVRKDGSIWAGRPINTIGAHAYGVNSQSVGICFEGNFETETMPDEQKNAGLWLVNFMIGKYPTATIKKHSDFNDTACPGRNFPFGDFTQLQKDVGGSPTLRFQKAAILDGYSFPKYGADGCYGAETDSVAKHAIVRRYAWGFKLPHLTSLVQEIVGVVVDGKCGHRTEEAIRQFQIRNGLDVDGRFGQQCWRAYCKGRN